MGADQPAHQVKHPDVPRRTMWCRLSRPSPIAAATAALRPQSSWPTSTGSLTSVTPNASRTPSRTSRARAATSDAVAPPRLVTARVCLVESAAGPGRPKPLGNPARSISQAALVLTLPSASGEPRRRRRLGPQPRDHPRLQRREVPTPTGSGW